MISGNSSLCFGTIDQPTVGQFTNDFVSCAKLAEQSSYAIWMAADIDGQGGNWTWAMNGDAWIMAVKRFANVPAETTDNPSNGMAWWPYYMMNSEEWEDWMAAMTRYNMMQGGL